MAEPIESLARVGVVHFAAYPSARGARGQFWKRSHGSREDDFFGAVEVTAIQDPAARREARALLTSDMDVIFGFQPAILAQRLSLSTLEIVPSMSGRSPPAGS